MSGDQPSSRTRSFHVAFVPGVTPDKWLRIWQERVRSPLEARLVGEADAVTVLHDGSADMCFVRLPVDREWLHVIPLYEEVPVVVVPLDHVLTVLDEVSLADLADLAELDDGPAPDLVPMSVARLNARKDVTMCPVVDAPTTQIGLAWRTDLDDPRTETFVGIVRGRTARSTRGTEPTPPTARRRRR